MKESEKRKKSYYDNNINGTKNLLNCMVRNGCYKIIFSSSACVYNEKSKSPLNEYQEIGPINPYGETKLAVEKILDNLYFTNEKKYSIACLRYFNPIGAHPTGLIGEEPKGRPNNIFSFFRIIS